MRQSEDLELSLLQVSGFDEPKNLDSSSRRNLDYKSCITTLEQHYSLLGSPSKISTEIFCSLLVIPTSMQQAQQD